MSQQPLALVVHEWVEKREEDAEMAAIISASTG
jgi:hypothetical protein